MMKEIDTYSLMRELFDRLDDCLNAPEVRYDSVLEDLCSETKTSEEHLKALAAMLENTTRRYKNIVEKRIKEMGEFS